MASSSLCLQCLRRSLSSIEHATISSPRIIRAGFSSSPHVQAVSNRKGVQKPVYQTKVIRRVSPAKKKRATESSGKPPAPGERKAMRKRVVLSNTSAVPVQGLRNLEKSSVNNVESIEGQMVGLADATVDALRALDAFKPSQGWNIFHRPATLVRAETTRLVNLLKIVDKEGSANERTSRVILTGDQGCGKSVLQLQAMAAAQVKGWILIHLAEAKDLIIGHTAFHPAKDNNGKTTYIQPHYTAELLGKILKANAAVLSEMQLAHSHKFDVPIQSNISLARLLEMGSTDPELAYPVWQVFLKEITTASQEGKGLQRPPVMLAIDNVHHMMGVSKYVDADLKPIHAQELALVADLSRFLGGAVTLNNGGIVLACTAASDRLISPTFDYLLEKGVATSIGAPAPQWDTFKTMDSNVEAAMQGVEVIKIGGTSKKETKSLMEYYALSGLLRRFVANHLVGEKWVVTGGGIIGALERACVLRKI